MERFSKRQIVEAGKAIVSFQPDWNEELGAAFRVAHAWRDGHLTPMRSLRQELSHRAKRVSRDALTAGRLKRFQSIRRKLKPGNLTLYQMQDIAGVRAIMPTMDAVDALTSVYLAGGTKGALVGSPKDYIAAPKADGYRSRHLVMKFDGDPDVTGGNRLTVELQIRTQLQHAWATAVEAVGLVRNENLKAGQGDPDWLRFFVLMSSEMAASEGFPLPPDASPDPGDNRAELRALAQRIEALQTLESYNQALRQTEGYLGLKGKSYLIRYDTSAKQVRVQPFSRTSRLANQWHADELSDDSNVVMVEIDKVDDLRAAYPNYFLDVRLFTERLRAAVVDTPIARPPEKRNLKWAKWLDFLHTYETPARRSGD